MRINKERALEIQKRRREEQEKKEAAVLSDAGGARGKKRGGELNGEGTPKRAKVAEVVVDEQQLSGSSGVEGTKVPPSEEDEEDEDLEAFEEGAGDLVTKKEAKKMYCLPEGTLQVCAVVEKDNPRNSQWTKMKLYSRSELRRRARKRHGGKEGLIAERRNREDERFRNDIAKTKDIFKS